MDDLSFEEASERAARALAARRDAARKRQTRRGCFLIWMLWFIGWCSGLATVGIVEVVARALH